MLGAAANLPRGFLLGFCERGKKRCAILGPASRCIRVDVFHVPLLGVLVKVMLLCTFTERTMKNRVALHPTPRTRWRERCMHILRGAMEDGDFATIWGVVSGSCNYIRYVDAPIIIGPFVLGLGTLRVGGRPC